jgi:hypothetical protein
MPSGYLMGLRYNVAKGWLQRFSGGMLRNRTIPYGAAVFFLILIQLEIGFTLTQWLRIFLMLKRSAQPKPLRKELKRTRF